MCGLVPFIINGERREYTGTIGWKVIISTQTHRLLGVYARDGHQLSLSLEEKSAPSIATSHAH
jgi:hypothetical protein